jgi:hypothetical protein
MWPRPRATRGGPPGPTHHAGWGWAGGGGGCGGARTRRSTHAPSQQQLGGRGCARRSAAGRPASGGARPRESDCAGHGCGCSEARGPPPLALPSHQPPPPSPGSFPVAPGWVGRGLVPRCREGWRALLHVCTPVGNLHPYPISIYPYPISNIYIMYPILDPMLGRKCLDGLGRMPRGRTGGGGGLLPGFDWICNAQRRVSTRPSHAPASSRHVECTRNLPPHNHPATPEMG